MSKSAKFLYLVSLFSFLAVGCVGAAEQAPSTMSQCGMHDYDYGTSYDVSPNETTPSGIPVDRTGQAVPSLETIDEVVGRVESCLSRNFDPDGDGIGTIPDEMVAANRDEIIAGKCRSKTFELPISRGCWQIKIPAKNTAVKPGGAEDRDNANGWMLTEDGSNEVLPTEAPAAGCLDKGLTPTEEFKCYWRAVIQDSSIVVTPSLYLLPDNLVRAVTGCGDPWSHSKLAECAAPTTPARSSVQ